VHRSKLLARGVASRAARIATACAALLVFAPAWAQKKPAATAPAPPGSPAVAVPASSRTSTAVAPAGATIPAPGSRLEAASVPPPPGARLHGRDRWIAVSPGGFSADLGKSVAVQVDYGQDRTPPGWRKLRLEWHLAVMVARPSDETPILRVTTPPGSLYPVQEPAGVETVRAYVVEVAPAARLRLPFAEKLGVFVDAGAGLCQSIEEYEREETFVGRSVRTQNVTGIVLRGAAGITFEATERLRVLFVPIALSHQIGPGFSAYTPSIGLAYRL
jgi:hypothetical protein